MTTIARAGESARLSRGPEAPARGSAAWREALWPGLGAAGLFLLMHPYRGIEGDARLYVGRALADLDPAGIGQDLMFVQDGQSRFSLFPLALRWLVEAFGPAQAALAVGLAGLCAWFAAAAALAYGLGADTRARWLVLASLVILPACYGHPGVFRVGEALATPRTLAEAAILAGLAAFLAGHAGRAFALALLGCLVHPIMGLAGLAVLALGLAFEDRRRLAILAAPPLAALGAALLGVPLFERLLQGLDPEVASILRVRCAELFPGFWPGAAWAPILVQAASILVAATLVRPRARRVLHAALAAGLLGVAVSALFGDRWPSLLVVQVQPWRLLWLTAVVGAAAFGLCAARLRDTPGGWITLLLLALAWVFADDLAIAAVAGGLALALHEASRRGRIAPNGSLVRVAGALVGLFVLGRSLLEGSALAWLLAQRPEGAGIGLGMIRNFTFVLPLALLAGLAWARAARHPAPKLLLGLALGLALAGLWDERSAEARRIEQREAPPGLARAVAARPGAVLWLDGETEAWLLLGRANWSSNLQGAGIVFSRTLALDWAARIDRLIAGGLASEIDRAPFHPAGPRRPDDPPAASVATLCAAPDAPAWIVVPLRAGQALPGHRGIFPLATPLVRSVAAPEGLAWNRTVAYGLLACGA
ncbi:hypothetical protein [Methylobacterium sp. J-068]|uniref:hypothetical protein n=1 Tax=Methylobacterium sp. J-068 TaxID=2836649 RepID=UPI001FBA6D2A|nr:hypothetical protein [Methylobacterium sp. J-068]MCJ2037053.1 hypothetical protein [Methylobacterium sp. J-068]